MEAYLLPHAFEQNLTKKAMPSLVDQRQFQQLLLNKMELARQLNLAGGPELVSPSAQFLHQWMNQAMPLQAIAYTSRQESIPSVATAPSKQYQAIQSYKQQSETVSSQSKAKQKAPTNRYNDIIQEAANKYGVDEHLIHAIIKMESNYNPNVKSHAGAAGLMQLMPGTAREVGVTDRFDMKQNIFGGTAYLSKMLKNQKGNISLALAAYNAGPANVKKYGGIPPFKETQNYVRKVMDYYQA